MTEESMVTSPEQQRGVERFYFHEARLLDNRQYQQWLALLCDDIRYIVPSRFNVQVDNRDRGQEAMLAVERELEGVEGMGNPLRDENMLHLMIRVERAYKINSWSENPPARTRRIIGNIEVMSGASSEDGALQVLSNFHLYYARPGNPDYLYSGQRRDLLRKIDGAYKIARREIILDYADIDKPTVGLLF